MAIDFECEQLLSITDAAKMIPGRPSVRTVWRWAQRGVHGVRLETIKAGQRRFTSEEAVRRFVMGTTEKAEKQRLGRVSGPGEREATERAKRRLQRAGA